MKKIFICLLVFLLVLVSCTTKSVKSEAPAVEVVEATTVESPAPVTPVVTPVPGPEVQVEPVHEEKTGEGVEIIPEKEVEPEVSAEEAAVAEAVDEALAEDWSMTITAAAPEEEKPVAAASDKTEPEQTASSVTSKTTAAPSESKEPAQTPSAAKTSEQSAEKETKKEGLFSKIGHFIANQKLLSIGILTCAIGFIYLVVALIISRRPRKVKTPAPAPEAQEEVSEPDVEPQNDIEEALRIDSIPEEISGKPAGKPERKPAEKKADSKQEDDDDAFLRSLLGEDKK
ncbi:MAG: hypothetical protein II493_01735 [Spirochaetales bacterium]|nr:hypothetical protein [Spirochaetales bacterium]